MTSILVFLQHFDAYVPEWVDEQKYGKSVKLQIG